MIVIKQIYDNELFEEASKVIKNAFCETKEKNGVVFAISDINGFSLKKIINDNNGICFGAWKDNNLVGTLSIIKQNINRWYAKGEVLKLRLVAVLPQYYGEHIGSQLVANAISYCKENKYSSILVQTPANNTPAQKLYEKFGFIKVRFWSKGDHDVIDYFFWLDSMKPSKTKCNYMFLRSKLSTYIRKIFNRKLV